MINDPLLESLQARLGSEARQRPPRKPALSLREARSAELRRMRRMRHVKLICGIGERVVFEGFDQLARDFDEGHVDHLLERLANLNPELLRFLGADKFPEGPTRIIGGSR
jgi:hypothetical protein